MIYHRRKTTSFNRKSWAALPPSPTEWKFYTQIEVVTAIAPIAVPVTSAMAMCDGGSLCGGRFTESNCRENWWRRNNGTDGVRANVSEIHMHPSYRRATLSYDIAVLKLDSVLKVYPPLKLLTAAWRSTSIEIG